MAQILDDDIWCCVDCLMIVANDDASGMDDETEAACRKGIAGFKGYLALNSDSETGEGEKEFSSQSCDVCGSHLVGHRTRLALLEG